MNWQEIAALLKERDEKGIAMLIEHYGPLMRYIIAPILTNAHDREDSFSEITMRIWEKIEQFDPGRGSWKAWLTALTRNAALNYLRKNSAFENSGEIPESTPSLEPTPEERAILNERKEALCMALAGLSSKDRAMFYRKYYYMQSTAQIAAELGMSERAVEGRLYRIKKKLREKLGGEIYD